MFVENWIVPPAPPFGPYSSSAAADVENLWTFRSKAVDNLSPEIILATRRSGFCEVGGCGRAFVPRFA
jgi:hypothetical protein